jgi:hypothetical protein
VDRGDGAPPPLYRRRGFSGSSGTRGVSTTPIDPKEVE